MEGRKAEDNVWLETEGAPACWRFGESNRPVLDRIQKLRIVVDIKELSRYCTDDAKPSKWEERGQQLLEEMERLGQNLTRPMAGLPTLKGLDVRIETHPDLPATPKLPDVLDHVLASETCSMLRSFSCCQLSELIRPGSPGRMEVYINGMLKVREPGSENLIVAVVSSCSQVRNLSIPSLALLYKNLKFHRVHKGWEKPLVARGINTIHEAEKIASIKRIAPNGGLELEFHWWRA
ncbi:hypothetical protein NEUTE1DRAFT_102206 [Neurospora tetrasperma FGSC 2508]|uniref:Uncharacterized protein n=1 Tax=Neurospora tetrasperma (strain FGSC 2508 / ATCC MYA-4615 / P0657) TaxID=510951 RepID=F8MNI5_NEUT8|nr:uncharacterized protein NEUTE1DRAFT_102206 [Neurospora tetrasperma FGSC 2508]EGO56953.1 hypothetical protein NEUTE1DRAFT_102206 [Neurospora tetrasperma FGSC 2508]